MRYAQNLAEYEQGIAEGIIDENVFVIVLDEKVAKFRGQTFDWSGGISQSTADARYIRKTVDEFDTDLTFAIADGIVGTDDEYYFIPEKAPSTALDSQILATKADIPEIDTSALVTKEELAEAEEVAAAALNELNEKKADKEYVEEALGNLDTSSLASKDELEALRNEVITNEEIVASSLNDLENRKADKEYVEDEVKNLEQYVEDALGNVSVDTSTLVTKEEFADVEEVWAASYNLLNQKISDVQQYIYDEAASRRQFDEAIAEIQTMLLENESVITAAWNQLNTRINAIEAAQAQGE